MQSQKSKPTAYILTLLFWISTSMTAQAVTKKNTNQKSRINPSPTKSMVPAISKTKESENIILQEEIEADIHVISSDLPVQEESNQASQIDCLTDSDCRVKYFQKDNIDQDLHEYLEKKSAKILFNFPVGRYQIGDSDLEDMMNWLREIAKREGQVSIEPISIKSRSDTSAIKISLVGDILQTSYSIYSRIRNYYKYSAADNYHAKLIYNPYNKSVMYVYFVHRRYGNLCETLYSRCDVIEYVDDELFDKTLSKRLEKSKFSGKPLRVVFHKTKAHLPKFEISLDRLKKTDSSLRLYKWFVASAKTEQRPVTKHRFMTLDVAVAAVKYSIQVYDMIQAAKMYAPARSMKTEIIYEGSKENGLIKSVIFVPE